REREYSMAMESRNPATGELVERFEELDAQAVEERLTASWRAFEAHRETDLEERAAKLRKVAGILDAERARFAALMTEEMGKTITAAAAEAEKCARACRFYADNGAEILA